jgi:hypothetical protein
MKCLHESMHSLLALKMEEERAFLLDKMRRLEARLREVKRLEAQLQEIQQLEASQEDKEQLFDELRLSFLKYEASSRSSDNEAGQSSSDDDSEDDVLLLPPPLAFADPDPAVNSVAETGTVCEEWPYRPALSLRKPPPCFPHTVFGEWLGGLTRETPRTEYVEAASPQRVVGAMSLPGTQVIIPLRLRALLRNPGCCFHLGHGTGVAGQAWMVGGR